MHSRAKNCRTYVIVDDSGLLHDELRRLMAKSGARELPITAKRADFVWLNTGNGEDKRVFAVSAAMKNTFDDGKRCLTNKLDMSRELARRFPKVAAKHLAAESRDMRNVLRPNFGVFILKPAQRGFFSGHGIEVVTSQAEYEAAKKRLAADGAVKVLISEYIVDPLLLPNIGLPPTNAARDPGDYKFHLRMYWLVNMKPFFHELWKIGKILTARFPYVARDWTNKEIHDTHFNGSLEDLYFPTHFPADTAKTLSVWKQMNVVTDSLAEIYRPHIATWPESDDAYEVFGLDYMVRSDNTVVFLELNDKVGFMTSNGTKNEFSAAYIDWVYETAIRPKFKNLATAK